MEWAYVLFIYSDWTLKHGEPICEGVFRTADDAIRFGEKMVTYKYFDCAYRIERRPKDDGDIFPDEV